MKKSILTGLLLTATSVAFSQNFYGGINVGYGFSGPSEVIGSVANQNSSMQFSETLIYGSFGGGINVGINTGYMINDHVGFDLGFNYIIGSDINVNEYTVDGVEGSSIVTSTSTQVRVQPSIVLSSGGDKLSVYTRSGFVVPVVGSTITLLKDDLGGTMTEADYESSGSFSMGFQGALGAAYNLNDKISLFGEFSVINLRIKSESLSMTRYTVDGEDMLADLPTYSKETVYTDELNSSSNNFGYNFNASMDKAREDFSNTSNYNGLFINIGLKYNF